MPSVTVLGAGHQKFTLTYDSAFNAGIAAQLAAAITQAVETGSVTPVNGGSGPIQIPPPLRHGQSGEYVQLHDGLAIMQPGYGDVVVTAAHATVLGSGDANEAILSGEGELTFIATGGSGTVVAGGGGDPPKVVRGRGEHGAREGDWRRNTGNDLIIVPGSDNGNWGLYTGGGNDTILAVGGGNDTIAAGGGRNRIELGRGQDSVQSSGRDTIVTGSGHDTIDATGHARDLVLGGTGQLVFVGAAGSVTLFGGAGSDTFEGGSGRAIVYGGQDGNNSLLGGTGRATLFGGGPGDHLYAQGSKGQELVAGVGNETLSAAMSTGGDALVAGSGRDLLIGGSGKDTFFGGTGRSTMVGGSGHDVFTFVKSPNGGTDLVMNFTSLDKIDLQGYGRHAVQDALASQTFANGSVTITLSDNTRVTFAGVSELTKSDFT